MFLVYSCELDNYDGPDAVIHGAIIDADTDELIEQDVINGTEIEYLEHGYETPATQYMVIKNDGTYRNNLMFSGTYTIQPVRGNFVPIDPIEVEVSGVTELDFEVQPYIRLKDVVIEKEGSSIVASFRLEQTVSNNVAKIGLFGHPEAHVGASVRTMNVERSINGVVDPETEFTLEWSIPDNPSADKMFFRVGALIDAPEAKYNYAPARKLAL
ncbi:DUF3823 domain-containing protein [Marinilabilia salmonicolor]|uniref:DUF3823 domain-containing protein n=1 Tax=Marinilabilia salmonicolor TaxID=989 RepID=UPI00029AE4D2|nr:DUF3823 domain-containing protein [Marinilabilia salmonicolor]